MFKKFTALLVLYFFGTLFGIAQEVPEYEAKMIEKFPAFDARQGIGVSKDFFYATNNHNFTKHRKSDGKPIAQWYGGGENQVLRHFDSMMELDGKLYASHSNYGLRPMTSSVEIFDADSLKHIGTHSFGMLRGSFTWLDRHDGYWWGTFANYDRVIRRDSQPYGYTRNTQVVKMDDDFNILQSWILPVHIQKRISPMSNSGGSWGPDGYLYLTGHDHEELYVMQIPKMGSKLHHAATVKVPGVEGQGIAWDRTGNVRILWGINKGERHVYKMEIPEITMIKEIPNATVLKDNFIKE